MTPEPSTDLAPVAAEFLLDPTSGELLQASPENAAVLLARLREIRYALNAAVAACTDVLVAESQRQGTRTLRLAGVEAVMQAPVETVWDVEAIRAGLEAAGCPQERIEALLRPTVEWKVDGSVARQLGAANKAYGDVLAAGKTTVAKPLRVAIKQGGVR